MWGIGMGPGSWIYGWRRLSIVVVVVVVVVGVGGGSGGVVGSCGRYRRGRLKTVMNAKGHNHDNSAPRLNQSLAR
jgi:hypothetical protein